MLSQRVAKFYGLQAWALGSSDLVENLDKSRSEFESALAELQSAPENNIEVARDLAAASEQWRWLGSALGLYNEGIYFPQIVDDASEKILIIMDRVTRAYEVSYSRYEGQ